MTAFPLDGESTESTENSAAASDSGAHAATAGAAATTPDQWSPVADAGVSPDGSPWQSNVAAAQAPNGSFLTGLGTAVLAGIVGAIVWAVVGITTDYHLGLLALAIGFIVGKAVERFGGGDARLPWVAAVVTLAACVLGDLGADVYIVMTEFHVGLVDVLSQPQALWEIFKAGFNGLDLAFYALGAFEGWRFGRIAVAKAHGTYTPKPRRQFKL